jgi:hypothetical protein
MPQLQQTKEGLLGDLAGNYLTAGNLLTQFNLQVSLH